MAIIKETIQVQMNDLNEYTPIIFICPVCKTRKELKIPNTIINKARQLTTVSIPKGLVCEHHFQAFVDKNFVIRGYQKVDFELAYDIFNKKKKKKLDITKPENFYDEIIIEGNYIEFKPNNAQKEIQFAEKKKKKKNLIIKEEILSNLNKKKKVKSESIKEKHVMSIEEIYHEFWEFVDDENEDFKQFIAIDNRRK